VEPGELLREPAPASRWVCCDPVRTGIPDCVRIEPAEPAVLSATSELLECSLCGGGVAARLLLVSAPVPTAVVGRSTVAPSLSPFRSSPTVLVGIRDPASLGRKDVTGGVLGALNTPVLTGMVGKLRCT